MDRPGVALSRGHWYRRLQVQLWLWAILPLTLVLVVLSFAGVYTHQRAMRDFVLQRDVALAQLYGRQIADGVSHGFVDAQGAGLAEIMGDTHLEHGAVVYVLAADGGTLYYPEHMAGAKAAHADLSAYANLASGAIDSRLADGTPTLASFASAGDTGWRVVVEEPVNGVIPPILQFTSFLPVLVAAAVLLSLITIWFSLRTIARPLQRLAEQTAQIGGGDVSGLHQDVGGVEEIRQLQGGLRAMVERIRGYQASLRDYIEGMTQAQEAERSRLSRELHDGTVQELIAMGQRLQLAQLALERGDGPAAATGLADARALSQQSLQQIRRTIRGLRPVYLEDLGFVSSLEALAREAGGEAQEGALVELQVRGEPRRLRPEIELAAFRVVQEALNNALHHAHAHQITLLARFAAGELTVSVADDGTGFAPPESPETLTGAGHFGLVGMRERALLLGGRLELDTRPGDGTTVTARFPLG